MLLEKAHKIFSDDPLVNFYLFLTDNRLFLSPVYSRVKSYAKFPEVVDYLVSFSMKHDAPYYKELDNKLSLSRLINTYQHQQINDISDFYPETFILPDYFEKLKTQFSLASNTIGFKTTL